MVNESIEVHDSRCDTCVVNNPRVLNDVITREEILQVMSELKRNKSPGIDGYMRSADIMIAPIVNLFNHILREGVYPDTRGKAMISPIH
jgi:hypothetical protein